MARIRKEANRYWSKEEKLRIISIVLSGQKSSVEVAKDEDISQGMIINWIRKYQNDGEQGLINKKKPGNPMAKYSNKKELTKQEELEYENMKLRIELERLKKGYIVKGAGQNKEYISINNKSLK